MKTKLFLRAFAINTLLVCTSYIANGVEPQYRVQQSYRDPFDVKSAVKNAEKRGLGKKLQTEIRNQIQFRGAFKTGKTVKAVINGKMMAAGDSLKVVAFGDEIKLELVELQLKPARVVFKNGDLTVTFDKK